MNRMGNKRRNQDFGDEGNDDEYGDFQGGPPSKRGKSSRDSEHLRKIFIGGLSTNTTEESLKSHFEEWGEIVDCVVMRDPNTKRSRGFGFITYKQPDDVDKAQENRPHTLDGKEVETKRATPREESSKPESRMSIKKVFVGGIKENIEKEHLEDYFSKFGNIVNVEVITEKGTNRKRGFAFVSFDDYDPVDKIVLERSHYINDRRCDVKKALSKEEMEKAKAKEMASANRQGGFGGGMGGSGGYGGGYGGGMGGGMGGGGFGGNRDGGRGMGGGMGGRGGDRFMGNDSDFRGGRGNFNGSQGNFNQGGGNYNQGGGFGNQGMQGGSLNQQSNWGNQGSSGGGNWGNQNQSGGYNQGGFNNQGVSSMGNQGAGGGSGNWSSNQNNWGSSQGGMGNQGGNQGFGGGSSGYNNSNNYGSNSGGYSYNSSNQGGGSGSGGWSNQGSGNYGNSGGSNYGNYNSGGQSDFGGNRNQGGSFGGRR